MEQVHTVDVIYQVRGSIWVSVRNLPQNGCLFSRKIHRNMDDNILGYLWSQETSRWLNMTLFLYVFIPKTRDWKFNEIHWWIEMLCLCFVYLRMSLDCWTQVSLIYISDGLFNGYIMDQVSSLGDKWIQQKHMVLSISGAIHLRKHIGHCKMMLIEAAIRARTSNRFRAAGVLPFYKCVIGRIHVL